MIAYQRLKRCLSTREGATHIGELFRERHVGVSPFHQAHTTHEHGQPKGCALDDPECRQRNDAPDCTCGIARDSQEDLIDGDPLSERSQADLSHRRSGTGWFQREAVFDEAVPLSQEGRHECSKGKEATRASHIPSLAGTLRVWLLAFDFVLERVER